VSIAVDDSQFAGWKKLELYDGATKVAELAKGPAGIIVKDLKTGYHAFSVLGTDGKGNIPPANPLLVFVRKKDELGRVSGCHRWRQLQENYMMRHLVVLILVGVVAESSAARAADVEDVAAFEGHRGPGWKAAANVHGAVGPNHIVDFTVSGLT